MPPFLVCALVYVCVLQRVVSHKYAMKMRAWVRHVMRYMNSVHINSILGPDVCMCMCMYMCMAAADKTTSMYVFVPAACSE
jgi:hypothetical protein